ncbi:TolC family protein [uncultured Draconibacterium sp.]|uniref:TolC family protein n=1 Tax=uncultured Draconibacterium sp. TaxID=1573823 RepID=UPI0025DA1876|nr:TolC family protein [uncultured Draconibacterium sp.]
MKQLIFTIISILTLSQFVSAQNSIETLLTEIENNNTTLSALRKTIDAEKMGNKTGIQLQNPEVEFHYLWGDPSAIGNRTDISVQQSFDFPSAYAYRNQIADMKNEQAELEYKKQKMDIFLQVRLICSELTYQNALQEEYQNRQENASQIAKSVETKLNAGEANILDQNKAKVTLLNTEAELRHIEIQRQTLLQQLATLNGGKAVEFKETTFQTVPIDNDFEQWASQAAVNNPVLAWLEQEIAISDKNTQLQKAQSLPKLNAGYMSEKVVGEHFQGVTVGVSIPLFENKNTVKYAQLKNEAAQHRETDEKLRFYNEMKTLHAKAIAIQQNITQFREQLSLQSDLELLRKALDKGSISLTEYLFELTVYYDSLEKLLDMERELSITTAQLLIYS